MSFLGVPQLTSASPDSPRENCVLSSSRSCPTLHMSLVLAKRIERSLLGLHTGPLDPWYYVLYNIRLEVCTLNLGHIFVRGSLQSSAIGSLLGISNEISASREPLVHLLSLAIRSSVCSCIFKK